jgi:hypothetical protein
MAKRKCPVENNRIEYHDRQNGDAIDDLTEGCGDKGCPDQHPDDQAPKLPHQERERRDSLILAQLIRAALLEALRCLLRCQTSLPIRAELRHEVVYGPDMSALACLTLHEDILL